MTNPKALPMFVSPAEAADRAGVPLAWLKAEIDAGAVPIVRAGRRPLVHLDRLYAILAERAEGGEGVE